MRCPECKGEGGWWNEVLWKGPGGGEWLNCWCEGGRLTLRSWLGYWLIRLGEWIMG